MPLSSKYVFIVSMDVDADKEALFNEVYDTEHVPLICQVPGVHGATRMVGEDFSMQLGGERMKKTHDGARYMAIYEIDSPAVLLTAAWGEASEQGRWPGEVRRFTRNRSHKVYRMR